MSLINDALKRANQAQKRQTPNAPVTPAPVHAPLQPVESAPPSSSVPWVPIMVAVALLLGAGIWFVATAKHTYSPSAKPTEVAAAPAPAPAVVAVSPPQPAPVQLTPAPVPVAATPKPAPVAPQPVVAVATPPAPVTPAPVTAASKPAPVVVVAPPTPAPVPVEAKSAPAPVPVPVVATVPAVPAEMPVLKLQGIFYRLTKSSAMINGRVLYVGDSIDGVKVIKIERQHVVVDFRGEHKVLDF